MDVELNLPTARLALHLGQRIAEDMNGISDDGFEQYLCGAAAEMRMRARDYRAALEHLGELNMPFCELVWDQEE